MMKVSLAVAWLAFFVPAVAAMEISVDSPLGRNLLSQARRLADEDAYANENAWLSGYSAKFIGCYSVKQWNDNANENNDVKIESTQLVKFRLCPSSSCSSSKTLGCKSGYGDYVVDMQTFVQSFLEAQKRGTEYKCEVYKNNKCDCEESDDKDDGFNRDYCEYDCFSNASMTECIDRNPYEEEGDAQQEFRPEEYTNCRQLKIKNNNNGNNNGNRDLGDYNTGYYVGPYCAQQGGAVYLGLFSDDTCTTVADTDFKTVAGFANPYESTSIVGGDCVECIERKDQADQNLDDAADADQVSEQCEDLYTYSGKCESNMPSGLISSPNTDACTYLEGIKVTRADGILDTGSSRPSAVATAFIVIFAMAFCAMVFYVWYLRTRLGVKQNSLL